MAELTTLKDDLNNESETIKFTLEIESNNCLPFLDVMVKKRPGAWSTNVYRKPTATGQYLHYKSNHPDHVKLGVAVGLIKRAKVICSDDTLFIEELTYIKSCLKNSGYPDKVINRAINRASLSQNENVSDRPKPLTTVCIPYVRNLSEKLRRLNNKHNIRTVFKSGSTIRNKVVKVKPENINQNQKNVVYKVPCSCNRNYIGQTSRPVLKRIDEHMRKVRNKESYGSKLSEHALDTGHDIEWTKSCILYKEQNWKKEI